MREETFSFWTSAAVMTLVAGSAFALSFEGLTDWGRMAGMPEPWLLPISIDAGVIACGLFAYRARRLDDNYWVYFGSSIIFSVLSVLMNSWHAMHLESDQDKWQQIVTHATPSFVLAVVMKLFLQQLTVKAVNADRQRAREEATKKRQEKRERKTKEGRQKQAVALRQKGLDAGQIADRLGVAKRTIDRYFEETETASLSRQMT